jgi:eukaryotic-like serine/threonine-protein kinase
MNQDRVIGGRYKLIEDLGKGRWSKTYLAEDLAMPNYSLCVVKQFQIEKAHRSNWQEVKNYLSVQAVIWQTLGSHPQITQLLACFEENDSYYLVQKYVEGQTISQRLTEKLRLGEKQVIALLQDTLLILAAIHKQGVIHRAIKPSNLVIRKSDRRIVLIDFGIINAITDRLITQINSTKLMTEENDYYPSEQIVGNYTASADIYALGMMAIQALTETEPHLLPFNPSVKTLLAEHNTKIDSKLVKIIDRMTNIDPESGYNSATQVLEDLERIAPPVTRVSTISPMQPAGTQITSTAPTTLTNNKTKTKITDKTQKIKPAYIKPAYIIGGILGFFLLLGVGELLFPTLRPLAYQYQGNKLRTEDPKLSLSKFQQAIEIAPNRSSAWIGRGHALYDLERYQAALAAYDKASQLKLNNAASWQGRGEVLYRLERYEAAVTAFDKALQLAPNDAEILNRKGRALYKLERYQEALSTQEQALKIEPNYIKALNDRGIALIGLGKYQEALNAFEQAQAYEPLDPELWQNKALVLQYLNRPQEALRLYQEAVAAYDRKVIENPKNITAILDKANTQAKLQQYEPALATYEQAILVNSESHLAWLGKGNTLFTLRRYQPALEAFDRALQLQPKSYLTWHNRGSLLQDGLRDLPKAIVSYEKSVEINPNFYHAWRDRGFALTQVQDYDRAIESFKKALSIQPNDYKSWVGRGIALSSLNRTDEAIASFDRAAEIQPNDPFVWMNRGAALEINQKYDEACDAYRQVKKINPAFSPAIAALKSLGCRE